MSFEDGERLYITLLGLHCIVLQSTTDCNDLQSIF